MGEGVRAAFAAGHVSRDELFLQTKFTFRPGQDHRLPYDPRAPIGEQVAQSLARSLEHLGVAHVDSLVLHGPMGSYGLAGEDWAAWRAMEEARARGLTRLLGVSNVSAEQLDELCGLAKEKPAFVQNRCYASAGWDARVRAVAARNDVVYQGFSLLTANGAALRRPDVRAIALMGSHARLERSVPEVIFRFALALGMIPLTGTSSDEHMRRDLSVYDFALTDADVAAILAASDG